MEAFDDIAQNAANDKGIARVLGVRSVVSLSLSAMMGSILVIPGPAISFTGSSAVLAIVVSGICVLSAAFSKSEIATAMPVSGGAYVYLAKAFGPMVGTMMGLGMWLSLMSKGAFGLKGFSAYLEAIVGRENVSEWTLNGIGLGLLAILLTGNLLGLKKIKTIQKMVTLIAMVFLFGLILYSFSQFDDYAFREHFLTNDATGFIECLGFVFMGYAGLTKICALASEIKNPGKNMPRAVLFSLAVFTPFTALAFTACLGTIPWKTVKKDYAPFYTIAVNVGGKELGYFVAPLCILTMVSMVNVCLMAVSRFPYAMARDGLLPPIFAATRKNDAPYVSLCVASFIIGVSICTLPVKRIAKLCSSFQLLIFTLVDISLFIFRINDEYWYKPTFLSPFYPFTQILGISANLLMLAFLGTEGLAATCAIVFLGFNMYYFYGQHHASFIGIVKFEKCFGIEPTHLKPVQPSVERMNSHPITEQEFEQAIWEFEEDNNLPHEAHILQVERLEQRNMQLMQEKEKLEQEVENLRIKLESYGEKRDPPKEATVAAMTSIDEARDSNETTRLCQEDGKDIGDL